MFGLISGTEEMVGDLAIDDGAVVVIELGLKTSALEYDPRDKTNLLPLAISAIKSLDQLGKVKVKSVGSDSNNRAIFVVKLLDLDVIASFSDHGETPKVGPALTMLVGTSNRFHGLTSQSRPRKLSEGRSEI